MRRSRQADRQRPPLNCLRSTSASSRLRLPSLPPLPFLSISPFMYSVCLSLPLSVLLSMVLSSCATALLFFVCVLSPCIDRCLRTITITLLSSFISILLFSSPECHLFYDACPSFQTQSGRQRTSEREGRDRSVPATTREQETGRVLHHSFGIQSSATEVSNSSLGPMDAPRRTGWMTDQHPNQGRCIE